MKLCRECEHWFTTKQWKGNCREHPWEKDQYSETAEPNLECGGRDFVDKYAKYKEGVK